jgi:poly(hydroxyalkanoate) depolymerase family esterase
MPHQLHTPPGHGGHYPALVVMLHGCSQTPADFARGTRMNELADRHGFAVVYPAQSARANAMHCWNWFELKDQERDRGEPGLIADLTRRTASSLGVDARRVFVAGMSAGGAMAVILGTAYPDVFSAVGVHSGLPYGAAHDASSAMTAMRRGGARDHGGRARPAHATPTIVFHGDADTTVDVANGAAIAREAVLQAEQASGPLREIRRTDRVAAGRRYSTTAHLRADSVPMVEYWLVHGAGHAWSGGSASGSFADPRGPDASRAMLKFFLPDSD